MKRLLKGGRRGRSGRRRRRRVRRADRRRPHRAGRPRSAGRRSPTAARSVDVPAGLRRVPRLHRHARAPARAGAGAQGDGRDRHAVRGRRRLHRRRLHAEHQPGERQRRRHAADSAEGGARRTSRASIRSARCRAGRRASSWPTSPSCARPAASRSPTMGIPVATALLARRALEYTSMFGMPMIEHCEDQSLKGDGVRARRPASPRRSGCKGIPGAPSRSRRARHPPGRDDRRPRPHRAHERVDDARGRAAGQEPRRARSPCEVTPHHFTLTDDSWPRRCRTTPTPR